jgi:peptidoglycan L-alanyl-D-glutamate endopeptidase CwlK
LKKQAIIGSSIALTAGLLALAYYNREKIAVSFPSLSPLLPSSVWDDISEKRIAELHPVIRQAATDLLIRAEQVGIKLRVTDGCRSFEEQARLYAIGREDISFFGFLDIFNQEDKPKIVTNAKPGQSYHNYCLAFDVVPMENGTPNWESERWSEIGSLGKSLGLTWGGDFNSIDDKPHFEMSRGYSTSQLLALRNSNLPLQYVPLAGLML